MSGIYILYGSNLPQREAWLKRASQLLGQKEVAIIQKSKIYETAAWGLTNQPAFLNQALEVETNLSVQELLVLCQEVEQLCDRTRTTHWGARTLDLDIIYYGNQVIQEEGLVVPHPRLQDRRFVLVPLCEIAPEFIHPILNKNNRQLLAECRDELPVKLYLSK
jgi:2-amino-4-hydroxy-6-hydroxymethyldihydropteridine diphosphokinase